MRGRPHKSVLSSFLYGVSKFLFSALAAAVVLALFASYFVALTLVPLFSALFLKPRHQYAPGEDAHDSNLAAPKQGQRFSQWFDRQFERLLRAYDHLVGMALRRPVVTLTAFAVLFVAVLPLYPRLGVSFFPRTDAGQFVILVKAQSGTRVAVTERLVAELEGKIREVIGTDLDMLVSNIGTVPGFSSIYTSNSAMHTAFVQVNLKQGHRLSSYEYMARLKGLAQRELPQVSGFFQPGGMVDGAEPGVARPDRYPGFRFRSEADVRFGNAPCTTTPRGAGSCGRIYSARHRLPRIAP